MQVLVALARANHAIVTRDELIEYCWDGRIVTDDAINRVLSRIRQVAADIGGGSFCLETITKVGYRLSLTATVRSAATEVDPSARRVPRRTLLIGASATVAAAVGGYAIWRELRPAHEAPPEAQALYRKGIEVWQQGFFQNFDQAEAWFRQAVEIDPQFAEAWGAMALTITTALEFAPEDLLQRIADRAHSAATRALALDAGQPAAKAALALIPSTFRDWPRADARLTAAYRGLRDDWFLGSQLGALLGAVARWDDSIAVLKRVMARNPYIPYPLNSLVYSYLGAGRLIEAEDLTARAIGRWPDHTGAWTTRMDTLIEIGRPEAALAMASDPHSIPEGVEQILPLLVGSAKAMSSRSADAIADFRRAGIHAATTQHIHWALFTGMKLSAMNRPDDAFEFFEAYFFRRGKLAANAQPIGPLTRIDTAVLFLPSVRSVWHDPRFGALTEGIGLNGYWRSIGYTPPHLRS
jgi:tetratricopeptide (TPR) repeat protein